MVFLCELFGMLRLKLDGARLDKLLCLGQAALGDGNIHAGCLDSVTISNGVVDLFLLLRRLVLVSLSSRIKPILKVQLEAQRLLFDVLDVGEVAPTSDVAVFASVLHLHNEFFRKRQCVAVFFPEMLFANVCRLRFVPNPILCPGTLPGDEFRIEARGIFRTAREWKMRCQGQLRSLTASPERIPAVGSSVYPD